ncbi:MAG: divergent PAP2 family protein [Firmicutes bacterium]|nr:divergent PAP2 family protein [Bacillota bacterium]MBR0104650.1 divergent PAP2 family protein [Bacillota bacterium]MBR2594622.1 divergent PAP2 family protein [Bacillota bacterium]
MEFIKQLFRNQFIWISVLSWFIAQAGKIFTNYFQTKEFDIGKLIGSGGMPSSHSALVMSLAVRIGRVFGFDSVHFAISMILSFIVMYDAAGVRRDAGKQAKAINMLFQHSDITFEEQLRELVGHTPIQVFAGAILGGIIACVI